MIVRKARSQFPRTTDLPTQSSKYWAKEKDRLLRQLLISDIEEETGRELLVYFARLDQPIIESDPDDISEILEAFQSKDIDIFIHTPGGVVDAVEKIVTVLRQRSNSYRVIVPSWAKSGGTVIALSAQEIILGVNSELGPIDPQIVHPEYGAVPAEFIAKDKGQSAVIREIAKTHVARARQLAKTYLTAGMLRNKTAAEIERVIKKISSATTYGSHGAVIDYSEALSLGLSVTYLEPECSLWKRLWLLYCAYDYDIKQKDLGKIFEGAVNSISRRPLRVP